MTSGCDVFLTFFFYQHNIIKTLKGKNQVKISNKLLFFLWGLMTGALSLVNPFTE